MEGRLLELASDNRAKGGMLADRRYIRKTERAGRLYQSLEPCKEKVPG